MTDSNDELIAVAGRVDFPRNLGDLTSTAQCPACFTPLRSTLCATCGLDLAHPAAAELAATSSSIADSLRERLAIIGRMRLETTAASVPVAVTTATLASLASAIPAPVAHPIPLASPDAAAPRHLGVQVILLVVGISLLSIGAIFFLVYAFITFGLVTRSVIIGSLTLIALVGAAILRRRALKATAEGIAVLAIVLVLLDAFAIRENGFFRADLVDTDTYWGVALIVCALLFLVWHRLSGVRAATIVAFAALPLGMLVLTVGLTDALSTDRAVYLSFGALAIGGALHALAETAVARGARQTERVTSLVLGLIGTVGMSIAGFGLEPATDWGGALGLGLAAGIAVAHAVLIRRSGAAPGAFALMFTGIAAAAAASIAFAVADRSNEEWIATILPVAGAVVVALVFEVMARHVAAWSAATVAALLVVVPLQFAVGLTLSYPALTLMPGVWSVPGGEAPPVETTTVLSIIALTVAVALVTAAWTAKQVLRRRLPVIVAAVTALALLSVGLVGTLWIAVAGWLTIAVIGTALLVVARRRARRGVPAGTGIRIVAAIGTGSALALAYASSWASIDTWWVGSVGAVAVLFGLRFAVASAKLRALLAGGALVFALVAFGAEGWHVNERFVGGRNPALEAVLGVLVLAVLALARSVVDRTIAKDDRRVVFWIAVPTVLVTGVLSWAAVNSGAERISLALPLEAVGIAAAVLSFAALLILALARPSELSNEATFAAVAAPVALAWLVDSAVELAGGDTAARALVVVGAVAAAWAASTVATTISPRSREITPAAMRISGLVVASVTALYGITFASIDPIELATVSLASALLAVGAVRLRHDQAASSWPWLAPGLLLLLVPSLFATFVEPESWRLVALGVASVATVIVGAAARLQAPLLIGAGVALVHALRTFAPQIVAVYQLAEWWIWAVIGGAAIVFVAVTVERRVRDLRAVGARISSLR